MGVIIDVTEPRKARSAEPDAPKFALTTIHARLLFFFERFGYTVWYDGSYCR
jgi:hypothetical protein